MIWTSDVINNGSENCATNLLGKSERSNSSAFSQCTIKTHLKTHLVYISSNIFYLSPLWEEAHIKDETDAYLKLTQAMQNLFA